MHASPCLNVEEEMMNHHLPNNLDDILDHIYRQGGAIPQQQDENTQPRRTLNVYIDVEEENDSQALPPTVESTLHTQDSNSTAPLPDEKQTESPSSTTKPQQTARPVQPRRRVSMCPRLVVLMVTLVAVLTALIGLNIGVVLPSLVAPSATVTLTTTSQHITTTSTLQLVTSGIADPTKHQIPGRALPAVTMSEQKTVTTTGIGHQDATSAHGSLTFYNSATYSQMVPAGTLVVGADGTQVVTDADVTIPAALFPTFGLRSVLAHAVLAGPQGNIRAGDIYGACCRVNVSAVSSAFTGGQHARIYQIVAPQDLQGVVSRVKTSLELSVQAALKTQVQASETLVIPLDCTQHVTPDHEVGTEAATVTVMIDETCTGNVYDTQVFTSMTTQNATHGAVSRLGMGYTPTDIQTSITQVTPKAHGTLALQVTSRSVWAYQYGPEQEQRIKAMIAGMTKDRARAMVLHLVGVQSASVTLTHGATVPTDMAQIHLLFVQM
jgi:hypothetical protein